MHRKEYQLYSRANQSASQPTTNTHGCGHHMRIDCVCCTTTEILTRQDSIFFRCELFYEEKSAPRKIIHKFRKKLQTPHSNQFEAIVWKFNRIFTHFYCDCSSHTHTKSVDLKKRRQKKTYNLN